MRSSNFGSLDKTGELTFRQVVWLFPVAYSLHVLEELPNFTAWARHYANSQFTMRDYLVIHVSGIAAAFMAALALQFLRNRVAIFIFFAFIFTPAVCFNIFFHVGATAAFGVYSPGLLTAVTIYPPLFCIITLLAIREGLLTRRIAVASLVLAGIVHAADVSHNVFNAW